MKKAEEILAEAKDQLGGIPDQEELNRLIRFYPTYEWSHRGGLVRDFFEAKNLEEMIELKLQRKGIIGPVTKQQRGGHGRWIKSKLNRLVIRLIYLRFRFDDDMSKRKANQLLFKDFWSTNAKDGGQSNIRKATRSDIVDEELNQKL